MHWWTVQQLRAKKALTRIQAVSKLVEEKTPRALDALETVLTTDPDANVRRAALQGIATLKSERAFDMLLKAFRDSDADVREAAARSLGNLGDPRGQAPLVAALQDGHLGVRRAAAKALDSLGWQPGDDTQRLYRSVALGEFQKMAGMGAAAVEPLINALKDPQNPSRRAVVEALSQMGDARAVKPLIAAAKDSDPHVRVAAIEALGRMCETSASETLVLLVRDKEHAVRAAAAAALGRIGDRAVVPALIAALKDDQWNVRHAAVEALGRLKDERAVEPLLPVLKDLDKDVRMATVQTLTHLNDLRSVKALVETLTDPQSEIRRAAAGALQVMKADWPQSEAARQALPALKAAQQHQDYWIRHAATETLAKINQTPLAAPEVSSLGESSHFRRKSASDMLVELLGDYDRDLRIASVEALARMGDCRAITPLVATLKDEDVWVREAAIRALDKLGWQPGAKLPT